MCYNVRAHHETWQSKYETLKLLLVVHHLEQVPRTKYASVFSPVKCGRKCMPCMSIMRIEYKKSQSKNLVRIRYTNHDDFGTIYHYTRMFSTETQASE